MWEKRTGEMTEMQVAPIYTHHGKKRNQGYPIKIHGQFAIGYFEHEQLVGYTTLEEIHQVFFGRAVPDYELNE